TSALRIDHFRAKLRAAACRRALCGIRSVWGASVLAALPRSAGADPSLSATSRIAPHTFALVGAVLCRALEAKTDSDCVRRSLHGERARCSDNERAWRGRARGQHARSARTAEDS